MRKIISSLFITLDGVVEAPGGGDTTLPELKGWTMPFFDPAMGELIGQQMGESEAMLLGGQTYRDFALFWPTVPEDDFFGGQMNNARKYVVSNTMKEATWKNSSLISGDIKAELLKLKEQPGKNINTTGSGTLVNWMLQNDLVDELNLLVFPIVLGAGKRLFPDGQAKQTLKLVNTRLFNSGVQLNTYQSAK